MLVRSPTKDSILYARRRVKPVFVKTMPIISEPKMNQTDGSMKSVKAWRAGRIKNTAWTAPMAMAVIPMGTTSVIHQVAARRNSARAALPSWLKTKAFPSGLIAGSQEGDNQIKRKSPTPRRMKKHLFQSISLFAKLLLAPRGASVSACSGNSLGNDLLYIKSTVWLGARRIIEAG